MLVFPSWAPRLTSARTNTVPRRPVEPGGPLWAAGAAPVAAAWLAQEAVPVQVADPAAAATRGAMPASVAVVVAVAVRRPQGRLELLVASAERAEVSPREPAAQQERVASSERVAIRGSVATSLVPEAHRAGVVRTMVERREQVPPVDRPPQPLQAAADAAWERLPRVAEWRSS